MKGNTMGNTNAAPRRSRLTSMVRRVLTPVIATGALLAGVLPAHAYIQEPGHRIYNVEPGDTVLWLGALENHNDPNWLQWCVEMGKPTPEAAATSVTALAEVKDLGQGEFTVTTPQMAWLLENKEKIATADSRAALSFLLHANYDLAGRDMVGRMINETRRQQPQVLDVARGYIAEAKNSAAVGYESMVVQGSGKLNGIITGIAVTNGDGNYVSGVPMRLTLEGPAIFKTTGTKQWHGNSGPQPLSLEWQSTGNGPVKVIQKSSKTRKTLTRYASDGSVQETLSYANRPAHDPVWEDGPTADFRVIYDFQPMATSNVGDSKKITGSTMADTLTAFADPAYAGGVWTEVDGTPVPVVFEGKAYHTGDLPAAEGDVPAGATPLATTTLTFNGPGTQTATVDVPADTKPGFVTWVWSVKKDAQGENAQYIHADWSDRYGLADETSSKPFTADINTSIMHRETRSGTYIVDDIWVDGMPDNHGEFAGGHGFSADVKTMKQQLFFFPEDLPVIEANKDQAELIAEVDVPAKNGYYASVGSNKFKVKDGNPAGTYVFVTSFAGDDRVNPLTTSVEDVTEQFKVDGPIPTLKTTATDKADGDKTVAADVEVTIADKVCYERLVPGKEYTVDGKLMDKTTGKPLRIDGKEVTATKTFTPTQDAGCEDMEFTFDGSALNGKKVVVFENLKRQGVEVAVHADLNDEGQTVTFRTPPPLAKTGAAHIAGLAFGSLALAGLGAGALMRRRHAA